MMFSNDRIIKNITNGKIELIPFFIKQESQGFLVEELLKAIHWEQEQIIVFGKKHRVPRETSYYGESPYNYSGKNHPAKPYPSVLKQLLDKVNQEITNVDFNSVLLNHYRNGNDKMGWHADNEPELGKNPVIASLSLGAERRFDLRHNETKETIKLNLSSGSLLIMSGALQHFWKHQVPQQKKITGNRINLTFRKIF